MLSETQPNTSRINQAALEDVVKRIDQISTIPQVALQVIKVAGDPNSTAGDLKAVMESDVALSARVLRCVNSSAYAMRVRITNLQQAITYLGMKQIRNLAMTAGVSELFSQEEAVGSYRRTLLWRHLVSVGIGARLIAMRLRFANFEDVFLAGLLHDVGIVLEDQYSHPAFVKTVQAIDPTKTFIRAEQQCMGFDHTMLGEKIAELWGFPEPIRTAVRHHHNSVLYHGESIDLLRCVEVANLLCTAKGISAVGVSFPVASRAAINALSLTKRDLVVMAEDLDREIAANASLFHM